MQIAKTQGNLDCEEFHLLLAESFGLLLQVLEDHATFYVRHYEINPEKILENIIHIDQERMVYRPQNVLFHGDIGQLIMLDDQILPNAFHGEKFACVNVLNQVYFSECPSPNKLEDFKFFKTRPCIVLIVQAH